jgi:hypothetical protein
VAPRRLERLYVRLVSLHSLAIGLFLLFATDWGARVGGFGHVEPHFFAQQAGAFHVVVAAGYWLEHERHGSIGLMLLAKGTAVLFLLGVMALQGGPWVIPVSAAGDAAMAALAVILHRRPA